MTGKSITCLSLILAGCSSPPPNYVLVMTAFGENNFVTSQTVIEGFQSKTKCEFAGTQWHNYMQQKGALGTGFTCLEPKP
jgi:hypothetical protein